MWRRPVSTALVIVVSLIGAVSVSAYTIPFVHYTEADGLPSSTVMGVAQDTSGCIWFATRGGISRYDGTDWRSYGREDGLPETWQRDVVVDRSGVVWALTMNTPVRVARLVGDRWQMLPPPAIFDLNQPTTPLAVGDGAAAGPVFAVATDDGRIAIWANDHWHVLTVADRTLVVHGVAFAGDDLLVSTSLGLYRITDPVAPTAAVRVGDLPAGPIYATVAVPGTDEVKVVADGWIGTWSAAGLREDASGPELHALSFGTFVCAAIDAVGGLYVANAFAVFYYHPLSGLELLTRDSGMISVGATDILVDREGVVWLASLRGVSKLVSRRLRSLTRGDGLLADEVSSVVQRRDGTIVLGHVGGLTFLDPAPRKLPLVRSDRIFSRATDLYEDVDGTLWAAMDRSGLARVSPDGDVHWYDEHDGLRGAVYAVARDDGGRLCVGTNSGLFRRDDGGFQDVDLRPCGVAGIPTIRRLQPASSGGLYVATTLQGVIHFTGQATEHWPGDAQRGTASAYTVLERPDGTVWVGTAAGLCHVVDGRLMLTAAPDPVVRHPVFGLVADDRDRVWIGTDSGVYRWDGSDLRHFDVTDGLSGLEVNRDAMTFDDQGRLWIGNDGGVSIWDGRLTGIRAVTLPIWIDAIEVDGQRDDAARPIDLSSGHHEMVICFRSPSFTDEARLRFTTCLEGFDAGWSEAAINPTRSVRYTSVPPGHYRFLVRALDREGRQSAIAASARIVVEPPLVHRPWFVTCLAILAIGFFWLVFTLLQGRRDAQRLARKVRERTAELADSEASVRAQKDRLDVVLASISDGVLAVDPAGIVALANPAAATLLGRSPASLTGASIEGLLPGLWDLARKALGQRGRSEPGGMVGPLEYHRSDAPDDGLAIECAVATMAARNGDEGLVLAFRDVTERRRAERERIRAQKLESLGVLAGGIAHDFNNLLTVIMGHASLLETTCREDQRSPIEKIIAASQRARRLTSQLLTFARGGAPKKQLTDLRAMIIEVATLALAGTNVSLELEVASDLMNAEVDRGQFEQVLTNLLINACQAMPEGGRVRLAARNLVRARDGGSGAQVEISVRDEGCGIQPRNLERIFEPYFTTKSEGTGLGLAIVHSIVSRHGGTVRVDSHVGRGAEFTVTLPATVRQGVAEVPAPPLQPPARMRLLILDDEPDVRGLLLRMLRQMGHEATAVGDGAAAIDAYRRAREEGRPFTAVIMDLTVPGGMGGKEALEQLRVIDPEVRAIVSSGYSHDPILADPAAYGFLGILRKPYDRRELERTLRTLWARAS